jgi:hypothetical protein
VKKLTTMFEIRNAFLAPEAEVIAEKLEAFWKKTLPTITPCDRQQMLRWLRIHSNDPAPIKYAIQAAAKRLRQRPFNDTQHHIAYISSVALSFAATQQTERAA